MKILRNDIFRLFFIACSILMMVSCNEKKQFDGYLYPIRENGLYGYIDSVGNRIIEPKFLWVSTFQEGLAMAVVDTTYREVGDSMAYEVGESDTIVNVYRMYAKYGYIDKRGIFAIEPTFVCYVTMPQKGIIVNDMDDCRDVLSSYKFRNNRALYCDTATWKNGYIDTNGKSVIEPKYYYSESFSYGKAIVKDMVADPVYYNELCLNPSKLRCAYIDTLGNPLTEFNYETLTKFNGRRGIGAYNEIIKDSIGNNNGYKVHNEIINSNGNVIKDLGLWNTFFGYSKDGISVARQVLHFQVYDGMYDSYSFVDEEGNYLEPLKGLSDVQLDSLNKCKDILEVLPEDAPIAGATYFSEGFAGITPDYERWFIIDKYLIIHGYGKESVFEKFHAFSNGLAAVKRNGKWGYINKKIIEQIPCKYDSCGFVYPFLEEIYEYDIQGNINKVAYINRNDSLIWESKIPKRGEIKNHYSLKEKKDWGKWIYTYHPISDYLLYFIIGVSVVLLLLIVLIWMARAKKASKITNTEKQERQIEDVNEITSNSLPNEHLEEFLSYPTIGQYTEVIKQAAISPDKYFDKLTNLRPVLDVNGDPVMNSGNFAVVYKMEDEHGKQYAVRCFHRTQRGREKNYKLICEELAKVSSPYLSPIRYYDKELFVNSDEYPVLLMDWIDGVTLDKYARKVIDDRKALIQLATNFRNLALWLLSQPFAHGDLKPDNILVKKDGSLVLVDYDGMFVPAMQGQKAREIGSPDFRNPSRTEDGFNKDIDSFPVISILLSLELLIENKNYLSLFGEVDRLLFSEEDYRDIEKSKLYKRAFSSYNEDVSELALMLKSLLYHNCNEDLISFLQRKEKRDKDKKSNERLEKRINATIIIYNLMVPFSVFCYSRIVPENNWNLFGVSLVVLISAILLYLVIIVLDIFRPYKRSHLYIDEDYKNWGCGFSLCDFLIPIRGLMSPYYHDSWYYSLLIIAIWICFFYTIGAIVIGSFELRKKIFLTSSEKIIEQDENEKEKEKIRCELRKEEQMQKKLKEIEEREKLLSKDDLPF